MLQLQDAHTTDKTRFGNRRESLETRSAAMELYRSHLQSQYADRNAFYSLKAASEVAAEDWSADVVTIMLDGLEQAKFAVPRSPQLIIPHRGSSLVRPRLAVHAAWAFGWTLQVAVLDETHPHDSYFANSGTLIFWVSLLSRNDKVQPSLPLGFWRSKDSSTIVELLARTLYEVVRLCSEA